MLSSGVLASIIPEALNDASLLQMSDSGNERICYLYLILLAKLNLNFRNEIRT